MELVVADGIKQEDIQDFLSIPATDLERFFTVYNYSITTVGMYAINKELCYCFYNRNRGPEVWVVPRHGSINGGPSWDELWEESNPAKLPLQIEWDNIIMRLN